MRRAHRLLIDLFPLRDPYTGIAAYCKDIVETLHGLGASRFFDITLFAPSNVASFYEKLYPVNRIHKLHKFFIPNKGRYDLWHTTFQYSKYFPESYSGKRLLTIHDLNFLHENITAVKREQLYKEIGRRIYKSDKVVTISNFVKADILKNYDVDPTKIDVIYNGCTLDKNAPIREPDYVPKHPFFFTVGMVEDKKNFKVLPAMLLRNDYELIIAGKTTDHQYCQSIMQYAATLGVVDRVHIVGAVPDEQRNWFLQNCIMFAFPSKAEGFGLPVIEAMRFGKPVVLSKSTSLPEIGGKEAYYFDCYDQESVATKTSEILANIGADIQLSEKLKKRAQHFTWERAALQYMKLYMEMLEIQGLL
ncbi:MULTISPECIES: glycosyltransferase family 4 protein [Chitinophagaceae]